MKSWLAGALAIASAALLTDCSEYAKIRIVNNSGSLITMLRSPVDYQGAKPVEVGVGKTISLFAGQMPPPGMLILAGDCTYAYSPPEVDYGYFTRTADGIGLGLWTVEIEPDFTLILLPSNSTGRHPETANSALDHRYQYPVHPVFKACRPPLPAINRPS